MLAATGLPKLPASTSRLGVDSTTMIVEWVARGLPLSVVLTADTGVEREESYAYLPIFQRWMDRHHIEHRVIRYVVIRYVPKRFEHWPPYLTLLENCLTNAPLPLISFGRHSCSLGPLGASVFLPHLEEGSGSTTC